MWNVSLFWVCSCFFFCNRRITSYMFRYVWCKTSITIQITKFWKKSMFFFKHVQISIRPSTLLMFAQHSFIFNLTRFWLVYFISYSLTHIQLCPITACLKGKNRLHELFVAFLSLINYQNISQLANSVPKTVSLANDYQYKLRFYTG